MLSTEAVVHDNNYEIEVFSNNLQLASLRFHQPRSSNKILQLMTRLFVWSLICSLGLWKGWPAAKDTQFQEKLPGNDRLVDG